MRILVTGGCGFIGNHVVRNALLIPGVERVVNLDLLTYSGNLENLKDVDDLILACAWLHQRQCIG